MRGLIAFAALCAAAAPAQAAVFRIVASDAGSVTVVDPAAVRFDGQTRLFSAWTVAVKRKLTDDEAGQPGYVRTLTEYDCVRRQFRWRTVMAYSRFGALVLEMNNSDSAWLSGYQARGQDAGLRAVCDDVASGAVSANSMAELVISLMHSWDPPAVEPEPVVPAAPKAAPAR